MHDVEIRIDDQRGRRVVLQQRRFRFSAEIDGAAAIGAAILRGTASGSGDRAELISNSRKGVTVCLRTKMRCFRSPTLNASEYSLMDSEVPRKEKAAGLERILENRQHSLLQCGTHIDQHVPATDQIEPRKGRILGEIVPRENA